MPDRKICVYCNQEAKYYCTCTKPNIFFCNGDREIHEALPGDHPIQLYKAVDVLKANPIFKQNLIEKIIKVRLNAKGQVNKVLKVTTKMIELITKETGETVVKLNRFVSLCNDILKKIYSIKSITSKKMYCPIETLLLFEDAENAISIISHRLLSFQNFKLVFLYSHNFPSLLYNFAETSIEFPKSKAIIQTLNPEKIMEHPRLKHYSRFLSLQNKKILITGDYLGADNGTADAFILDIVSELLIGLPNLINPKNAPFNGLDKWCTISNQWV